MSYYCGYWGVTADNAALIADKRIPILQTMARPINSKDAAAILQAVQAHGGIAGQKEIAGSLGSPISERTLQLRLRRLVDEGRLVREGARKVARYRLPAALDLKAAAEPDGQEKQTRATDLPLSTAGEEIRNYVNRPLAQRKPVGYNREFLGSYWPNATFYLSSAERAHLAEVGRPNFEAQAAGTYAKQVLHRLLIDLSWNSSRLEGNTYSLLDTRRLIEFGLEAQGRDRLEAQMIVNHKEAIGFLVGSADEIGFNRYTILNLHAILAHNLLPDEAAAGRLRQIAVGIEKSTFHPLAVPQLIEECFNELLAKAAAIQDPFEQAFFFMVQLPYLQPFDDVNKRVSRLGANIPFIRQNFSPLSFIDVPQSLYTSGILGVYELNRTELLKDVFVWAYERSAQQYTAVRQSLGEPDPFRFRYGSLLRQLVQEVVRGRMNRSTANSHIESFAERNVEAADRERFREMAESELLNLHEGNFARYQIRPSEFQLWEEVWNSTRSTAP
jgi:DNA-binding Lrp family transcriptional regulator